MIPFKNTDLKLSFKRPKHIIIHHTAELAKTVPQDEDSLQLFKVQKAIYTFNDKNKLGYHVIFERVKADYIPIVCQPWFTECVWEDIDPQYYSDLHVAFLGNYEYDMLMDRAYKVLAFQFLVPMCRVFRLDWPDILLHKEISNDPNCNCPGEFFDRTRMKQYFKYYFKRGPSIAKI